MRILGNSTSTSTQRRNCNLAAAVRVQTGVTAVSSLHLAACECQCFRVPSSRVGHCQFCITPAALFPVIRQRVNPVTLITDKCGAWRNRSRTGGPIWCILYRKRLGTGSESLGHGTCSLARKATDGAPSVYIRGGGDWRDVLFSVGG
jgi:hypothetical protein